ncbi:hypothetical protein V1527DRAFT_463357 [Lipomyces starkeyi]
MPFDSMLHFQNFMSAVKQLAGSNTEKDTEKQLQQIEKDFPSQSVAYFWRLCSFASPMMFKRHVIQWWLNGQCERWAEVQIRTLVAKRNGG